MKGQRCLPARALLLCCALGLAAGCQAPNAPRWNPFSQFSQWKADRARQAKDKQPLPDKAQCRDMRMSLAGSLERQGNLDQAIKAYMEIAAKDKTCFEAQHRLAVLYDQKGNFEQSAKYYKLLLDRDKKSADLLCDYGYSLYLQRRWAESETQLRQALRLDKEHARSHNNLGLVLAHTERLDEALLEFARAGCEKADAHLNLAYALVADKQWEPARRQVELALAADPKSSRARQALVMLPSAGSIAQSTAPAPPETPPALPSLPVAQQAWPQTASALPAAQQVWPPAQPALPVAQQAWPTAQPALPSAQPATPQAQTGYSVAQQGWRPGGPAPGPAQPSVPATWPVTQPVQQAPQYR